MRYKAAILLSLLLAGANVDGANQRLPSPETTEQSGEQWIESGTYFTAAVGYANVNWLDFSASPFVSYNKNQDNGFGYSFSVGYRFDNYPFELEGGFCQLPTVSGRGVTTAASTLPIQAMNLVSWFAYLAGKFRIKLLEHFFIFVGAGAAYREFAQNPQDQFSNPQPYYYAATAMAGLQWYFAQDWELFTQYYFVPGYNRQEPPQPIKHLRAPKVNFLLFGLGYKFSI